MDGKEEQTLATLNYSFNTFNISPPMHLHIIIPTLNEEKNIWPLVRHLFSCWWEHIKEILVVDGWSSDKTIHEAEQAWATVLKTPKPWRALQMNTWAKAVLEMKNSSLENPYLRFCHADIRPPESCVQDIFDSIQGWDTSWCFITRSDTTNISLQRSMTNRTKYNHRIVRMWEQTIRITVDDFFRIWSYDESLIVCEEIDLYRTIYKDPAIRFNVIQKEILVSARKYEINGIRRTRYIYACIYLMYRLWFSQEYMIQFYTKNIQSERLADAQEYLS